MMNEVRGLSGGGCWVGVKDGVGSLVPDGTVALRFVPLPG